MFELLVPTCYFSCHLSPCCCHESAVIELARASLSSRHCLGANRSPKHSRTAWLERSPRAAESELAMYD
jgi:hypothetical protein